jgi:hypothetical protein
LLLLYVLIPWTAINLVDYIVGIAVEIPFMSTARRPAAVPEPARN